MVGHVNNVTGKCNSSRVIVKIMEVAEGDIGLKVGVVSTVR